MVTSWVTIITVLLFSDVRVFSTPDEECCIFEPLQKGCQETFQNNLECVLQRSKYLSDGECPRIKEAGEDDESGFYERGTVRLEGANTILDVQCHSQPSSDLKNQCKDYHQSNFIGLNILFTLSGWDIDGVLFDLRLLKGKDQPPLRSTEENCHYLLVNSSINNETAFAMQEMVFEYSSFMGLHPGSQYLLRATTLPIHPTEPVYSTIKITIPNCPKLPAWKKDYFCTRPSPANWGSTIVVKPNTLDVTFSVWPDTSVFNEYILYLILGAELKETNIITKVHISVDDIESLETMRLNLTEEKVIQHKFDVSSPGMYMIVVLPSPDDACIADTHWGGRMCLYDRLVVNLTNPDTPMLMIILVVVFLLLLCSVFAVCLLCYSSDICSNMAFFHIMKDVICGKCLDNPSLDEWTVTSEWHGIPYQWEPLKVGKPCSQEEHQTVRIASEEAQRLSQHECELKSLADCDC
ncbi:hypothetical protein BSL78_15108 [Apostichopus japonicus]|uniref:Uncharacterized protein n=1 Tax=Stichopus japonicus TaxID=307972 RepID=A0A2G8KJ58_STIJA|nr:hypothetical protein BSL78_15108 [Apostichopus japonicus]